MSHILKDLRAHYGSARCGLAYTAGFATLIIVLAAAVVTVGAALFYAVPA